MGAALFGCQRDPPPPSSMGAASASAKVVPSTGGSVLVPSVSAPVSVSAAIPSVSASVAVADAGTIDPMRPELPGLGPGKWTFEPDGTLACECKSNSHVIWWKASQPKDFDAAVEVQFLGDESSAGLLFRTQGQDFYNDMSFYQFEVVHARYAPRQAALAHAQEPLLGADRDPAVSRGALQEVD